MKTNKSTIIYGNGSMAKVLYSYMKHDYNIVGFCVDKCCIKDDKFMGLPLVAFEEVEKTFLPKDCQMINSIGFVQMNELRKNRSLVAKSKGYELISYIDKSVKLHDDVEVGENCIILDLVSIHPGTKINAGTFISSNVSIGHDCNIGEYNWINSGVSIAGYADIGECGFWGVNSSCGNNVKIGSHNYISANTFISRKTNDNEVYLTPNGELFKLSSTNFLKFIGA